MSTATKTIVIPDLGQVLNSSHFDKWVALSNDFSHVLAAANSVSELVEKLTEEEKISNPVFYKVPAKNTYYIPKVP